MTLQYHSGAPAPLTPEERARLPEHLQFADKYKFSRDGFDQIKFELDAIAEQRAWLAAERKVA